MIGIQILLQNAVVVSFCWKNEENKGSLCFFLGISIVAGETRATGEAEKQNVTMATGWGCLSYHSVVNGSTCR